LVAEEEAKEAAEAAAARESERAAEATRLGEEERERLALEATRLKEACSRGGTRGRGGGGGGTRGGITRGRGMRYTLAKECHADPSGDRFRHTDDEYSSICGNSNGDKDTFNRSEEACNRHWIRREVRGCEE